MPPPRFGIRSTVIGAVLLILASRATGQQAQPPTTAIAGPALVTGNASCLSVACHGGQAAVRGKSESQLQLSRAGRIWLQQDPHAKSAATIGGARYQEILDRLAGPDSSQGEKDARRSRIADQCAACHDPTSLELAKGSLAEPHGIGCESCHGNAGRWLARHYERDVTSRELGRLGLQDLKHPFVRATVCASCHVGDARHDLNHDMLAAGHPPLRFEFASDHARLPKHWRTDPAAATTGDEAIQLWAAGQLGSAAAALQLLADRAERVRANAAIRGAAPDLRPPTRRAAPGVTPWPELAEYNCLSCHQRVRTKEERAVAPFVVSSTDGAVAWSAWHYRLALPLAERLDPRGPSRQERWRRIALLLAHPQASDAQLASTSRQAIELHDDLNALGGRLRRLGPPRAADMQDPAFDSYDSDSRRLAPADVLALARGALEPSADWESLCQTTLGLEAVRRALRPSDSSGPTTLQSWREADVALRRIRETLAFGERNMGGIEGGIRQPVDWPRIGLPDAGAEATAALPRDWPALIKAFDRPLELLRALDAIQ